MWTLANFFLYPYINEKEHKEWERSHKIRRKMRSQGREADKTWLQHFQCSDLALLRTHQALWKQTINKKKWCWGGNRSSRIASLQCPICSSHRFQLLLNVAVCLWRAGWSEQQGYVHLSLLPSSSTRHKSTPRYVYPPHLPDNRLPHRTSVLEVMFCWFSAGSRSPLWRPGSFLQEEFSLVSLTCLKVNPNANAFQVFLLATKSQR